MCIRDRSTTPTALSGDDINLLRRTRQTLGAMTRDEVGVLRANSADSLKKDLGLHSHHITCLKWDIVFRSDHGNFIQFQSHAVRNKANLIVTDAHEPRRIR